MGKFQEAGVSSASFVRKAGMLFWLKGIRQLFRLRLIGQT